MLTHFIPQNLPAIQKEFIEPVADDYFIWWVFKHKCVMCKKPATEINEIVPRSRSKKSIKTWQNRVTLCRDCHTQFHHKGVTLEKIENMQKARKEFLMSMGREKYLEL